MTALRTQRLRRLTSFKAGLLSGVLLPALTLAAGWPVVQSWVAGPKYEGAVVSLGRDVSDAGGRRLEFLGGPPPGASQVCNEGCDDLHLRLKIHGEHFPVQVLSAKGTCVVCTDAYVVSGPGAWSTTLVIHGRPRLRIDESTDLPRPPAG